MFRMVVFIEIHKTGCNCSQQVLSVCKLLFWFRVSLLQQSLNCIFFLHIIEKILIWKSPLSLVYTTLFSARFLLVIINPAFVCFVTLTYLKMICHHVFSPKSTREIVFDLKAYAQTKNKVRVMFWSLLTCWNYPRLWACLHVSHFIIFRNGALIFLHVGFFL